GQGIIIQKSRPDLFLYRRDDSFTFIEIEMIAGHLVGQILADIEGIFGPSFSNQSLYGTSVEPFEGLKTFCSFYPVLLGLIQE
ncbi:unnamed protein product, partial [marine sediment metagenome]